ncbi:PLC-like phosphodiesterase [Laetiporus sulphureus 93-53]|uniref:PLC-like phosphodiesterase n=1 Tax=Laetiporus sulphureus 93-53 TaxID=1314785 RepID=A0A165CB59_9APHY|nr:PLC-like phosphodiesterase [Laetiporus sulphureus 93-53]KZT02492.1 PLC-like phosphodiesterase [Laetiporus sulphureus 93-53]
MRLSSPLTRVVLGLLLSPIAARAVSVRRAASTCNGYAEFCDRSFGNITFVGAHDSYSVSSTSAAANQDYNVTQQLNDGVRMLQMQTHNESGTIELCHTSCDLLDGGSLENYLQSVKSWMDDNTDDVVSMLIVNSYDNFLPSAYDTVFKTVGLDTMAYSPSNATLARSDWPTLGTLIDNGTRLVVFLTTEADYSEVPYLIDEFTNIWETEYDVTSTSDFNCDVNRTYGDTSTQMYLINHFLDESIAGILLPDKSAAADTNAVNGTGSLGEQVSTCLSDWDRAPNFMLVDFYEYGNGSVFEVAASANGVTYTAAAIATPISSDSTSTTGSTSNAGLAGFQINRGHLAASLAVAGSFLFGVFSIA